MTNIIRKYLFRLFEDCDECEEESIFPIDSFEKNKKGNILRPSYPKLVVEDIGKKSPHLTRILIDFDRTINKYTKGWNDGIIEDEKPIENSKEAIDYLYSLGFKVYIFTARLSDENADVNDQYNQIREWLDKYDFKYEDITSEKLPAIIYIDDRGFRFSGNWSKDIKYIKEILFDELNERNEEIIPFIRKTGGIKDGSK